MITIRFRLYRARRRGRGLPELILEEWRTVDPDHPQLGMVSPIEVRKLVRRRKWMLELFSPEWPRDEQYLRFGSDPTLMVDPEAIDDTTDLAEVLDHPTRWPADFPDRWRHTDG